MKKEVEKYKLPKGWTFAQIGDLIGAKGLFNDGDWVESKDQDPAGSIRLIQLADIGDGDFKNRSDRFMSYDRAIDLSCTFLTQGDILLARMPSPIGRCCVFPLAGLEKYVTVVDIAIIRVGENSVNNKYLMYILNSPQLRKSIERLQTGTTRKRISKHNLGKVTIPVAPLWEQNRIVSKVDHLFSKLEKSKEQLEAVKKQLFAYRQLILDNAIKGKLIAEHKISKQSLKTSKLVKLGTVIDEPKYGTSKKCEYNIPGKAVLRIPNIIEGIIDNSDLKYAEFTQKEIDTYNLQDGDLLVIRSNGSVNLVGKCALVSKRDEEYLYAGYLIRLRPDPEKLLSKYLFFALNSRTIRSQIEGRAKSTSGVNNINSQELKSLNIPLFSLEDQIRIVQVIESKFSLCDKIDKIINDGLDQLQIMHHTILNKAFEGKLVNQDESDTPAELFVSQIKNERTLFLASEQIKKQMLPKQKKLKTMPENLKSILQLLKESKKPVSAKVLWNSSEHKGDIDGFYASLKELINKGNVKETSRKGKETFLTTTQSK